MLLLLVILAPWAPGELITTIPEMGSLTFCKTLLKLKMSCWWTFRWQSCLVFYTSCPIVGFYVFVCVCVCMHCLDLQTPKLLPLMATHPDFLFQHSMVNIIDWDLYGWVVLQLCSLLRLIQCWLESTIGLGKTDWVFEALNIRRCLIVSCPRKS